MNALTNAGIDGYSRLHFEWFLVDWCNFKCSYCSSADIMAEKYSKRSSPGKYQLVLKQLGRLDNEFEMDLFGGEPTLHPEFEYVVNQLDSMPNCTLIEIKTNLSKPLHFLENICKYSKVKLAASYHAEYYNQKFLDKCVALKDHNFYVHINLSDKPEHWPQIKEMIRHFDENSVKYDLNLLWSTTDNTIAYTQEFYELFQPMLANISDKRTYRFQYEDGTEVFKSGFVAFKEQLNKFTGYKCKALLYEILSDGTFVNGCTRVRAPLMMNKDNMCVDVTCQRESCHADFMLDFYKQCQK
jgi:organic radical activating enzyme